MHVCSIYKRDIMRYHTYRCVHYVALLYILLYIYKKYICIHYIHIMRLLIVTVVCEYIPRLGSPYRFTTSEMRSLCSCNGSKGSCGIAKQEGFRPASRDGKGCCQWSLTHGRWPEQVVDHALGFIDRSPRTPGCCEKQNRSGGDDLTVFALREEHHVAGITVLWRFDLDVDSVCCFLIVPSIYKHPFNAHLLGQPRQVVDDLIRKHSAMPGFGWRNAFGSNHPCTLPSKETHTEVWISFEWGNEGCKVNHFDTGSESPIFYFERNGQSWCRKHWCRKRWSGLLQTLIQHHADLDVIDKPSTGSSWNCWRP